MEEGADEKVSATFKDLSKLEEEFLKVEIASSECFMFLLIAHP